MRMFMIITGRILSVLHINFIFGTFFSVTACNISLSLLCNYTIDKTLLSLEVISHYLRFVRSITILEYRKTRLNTCRISHTSGIDSVTVHIHCDHCRSKFYFLIIYLSGAVKMSETSLSKYDRIASLIYDRSIESILAFCRIGSQCIRRK